ncbi:Toll/interleukin-1 receptor domain-containing protein [Tanacetum coccineum]
MLRRLICNFHWNSFWLPFWRIPKEAKEHADDQLRSSSIKDVVANDDMIDDDTNLNSDFYFDTQPRKSYAKLLRTILIIMHSICFYKTKPEASGKSLWEHLSKVYRYLELSIRPDDSRYGENPNRLQRHTQFQVILKPDSGNSQDLFIRSLSALGDFMFVDNGVFDVDGVLSITPPHIIPKEAKEHTDDQLRSSSIKYVVANDDMIDDDTNLNSDVDSDTQPRKSYAKLLRTILIIVHSICFYKTKPEASGKSLWEHHSKVYSLMIFWWKVILKPDSGNSQDLFIRSLSALENEKLLERLTETASSMEQPIQSNVVNAGDFVVPVWNVTYYQFAAHFLDSISLICFNLKQTHLCVLYEQPADAEEIDLQFSLEQFLAAFLENPKKQTRRDDQLASGGENEKLLERLTETASSMEQPIQSKVVNAGDFVVPVWNATYYHYDPVYEYLQFVDNGVFDVDGVLSITPSIEFECFSRKTKNSNLCANLCLKKVYAGHKLEDSIILSHYSVHNDSTIHLVDNKVTRLHIHVFIYHVKGLDSLNEKPNLIHQVAVNNVTLDTTDKDNVFVNTFFETRDAFLNKCQTSHFQVQGLDITALYNPEVYCKPIVDEDVAWLSNWPIGNILDAGEKVNVCIFIEEGLVVSVCGANLEYTDDGEIEQEENFEYNTTGKEVIGGDLYEFQVTRGGATSETVSKAAFDVGDVAA